MNRINYEYSHQSRGPHLGPPPGFWPPGPTFYHHDPSPSYFLAQPQPQLQPWPSPPGGGGGDRNPPGFLRHGHGHHDNHHGGNGYIHPFPYQEELSTEGSSAISATSSSRTTGHESENEIYNLEGLGHHDQEPYEGEGGVLIYIDNSNIWINTMEKSAKTLGFRNDIKQDQRTRVNIIKLLATASAKRPIIRAVLYGSEPPPVAKFWNNVKECKFCKVDVQVTKRSTYSNRERDVDQNIMLDIGEDVVIHSNHAKHGGTVIIFTGDGGMIAAVRRALVYNWNVEVWAYRNSLAKDYLEEAQKEEKFTIKYLDDVFQEVVFYTLEWKSQIPPERSFVLTLHKLPESKLQEVLESIVNIITELVRMPVAGKYLHYKKENGSSSETHLAIVCSVGKLILKEDSRSDFHHKEEQNQRQNKNTNEIVKKSFHFPAEQWERLETALNLGYFKDEIEDVKAEIENIVQDSLSIQSNFLDNPKYDFNTEVYQKVEHVMKENKIDDTDITQELKANWSVINLRHKPRMRSLPQFIQDTKFFHLLGNEIKLESPANEDDGEGGYTVQAARKGRQRKFQKYSQECKYSFRCHNGFKCTYFHSDKEKEFFKIQPDPKLRYSYKVKACDHYKINCCKWRARGMSYMCPFSHGYFCVICKCDEDGGHDLTRCPKPPPPVQPYDETYPTLGQY